MKYSEFCLQKKPRATDFGFEPTEDFAPVLYPFQLAMTRVALRRGRCALFAECGLGKTPMQLVWSHEVARHVGGQVLILAPLAVSQQTIREGTKFGLPVSYARDKSEVRDRVTITNYERLDGFDLTQFAGIVLDESSILKAYTGKTKRAIVDGFKDTPYRLACSATPAPNDYMELGNHSEFLGIMSSNEMLARWFIVNIDGSVTCNYRIKGHAVGEFWDWVSSWASMASRPSDISPEFDDSAFELPQLNVIRHCVGVDITKGDTKGKLFRIPETSATNIHVERRLSIGERVEFARGLIASQPNEPWLIWADTDYEADALAASVEGLVNVKGSLSIERKESALLDFTTGASLRLLTKPKIAGFGLNWQHCANVMFIASTFSFESWYQAIRRCYRFGQTRQVNVHMVFGSTEASVMDILERKRIEFVSMQKAMFDAARRRQHQAADNGDYLPRAAMTIPNWLREENESARRKSA